MQKRLPEEEEIRERNPESIENYESVSVHKLFQTTNTKTFIGEIEVSISLRRNNSHHR